MKYKNNMEIGRGGFGIVESVRGEDGLDYAIKKLNIAAFPQQELPTLR